MLLRQIEYFQAVVENNSFTLAAEQCNISQSAISQQIKVLEDELGVALLERQKRKFSLTPAGELFYKRILVLTADLERMCRETVRVAHSGSERLGLGYLKGYGGAEFDQAVGAFTRQYPDVQLDIISGNHEDLYDALRFGRVDLVLNDQRRAFSEEYVNVLLTASPCYIELSTNDPLSRLDGVEITDLKNTPCILVASKEQQENERTYYRDVVGFHGGFLFADNLREARVMLAANRGVMPIEGVGSGEWYGSALKRVPLLRSGEQIRRNYCAFWKKENASTHTAKFANFLMEQFSSDT